MEHSPALNKFWFGFRVVVLLSALWWHYKGLIFYRDFFLGALYIRLVKNVNNGLVNRMERVRLCLLVH